jgi:hypothetical protein
MDVFITALSITTGGILGVVLAAVAIFALLRFLVLAVQALKALNLMAYRALGLEERDRRFVEELRRLREEERHDPKLRSRSRERRRELVERFGVK